MRPDRPVRLDELFTRAAHRAPLVANELLAYQPDVNRAVWDDVKGLIATAGSLLECGRSITCPGRDHPRRL